MLTNGNGKNVLGILGGMGPLASAEFLKTIYERSLYAGERHAPPVLIYSDTSFPDRTQAILQGSHELLLVQLTETLRNLLALGVSRIVICCLTIHYLLPRLPLELREPVWSLLDVIFARLAESREKHLLLCTNGARSMELFQSHSEWQHTKDLILLPCESDQHLIHELIYRIKRNENVCLLIPVVETLLARYEVRAFIAGCTEMHLLAKQALFSEENGKGYRCIDPLIVIAGQLAAESKGDLAEDKKYESSKHT